MQCPACAAEVAEDNLFCESCGFRLQAAAVPATNCTCGAEGATADEDGFCTSCGRRVVRPASDHIEETLSANFAAVSDRGLKHDRNEDRLAIFETGAGCALVVCDGVSASRRSELASSSVADGVVEALSKALRRGRIEDPVALMRRAIAAGIENLAERTSRQDRDNPPSTTVVAALVTNNMVTVGWVGDSRAYWVDRTRAWPLTQDHSWLNEMVTSGQMTPEQAEKSPQAHAITRWIGADAGEESTPDVVQRPITGAGLLLLCTDGLWNYAATHEAMARLVGESSEEAIKMARRLCQFANDEGGQDNVTVAVLRVKDRDRLDAVTKGSDG